MEYKNLQEIFMPKRLKGSFILIDFIFIPLKENRLSKLNSHV